MAKILISALGVGPTEGKVSNREYRQATYRFKNDSEKKYKTPFVSAAIAEHLEIDRLFLVGTCHSMWEKVYEYFTKRSGGEVKEDYWLELADKVSASNSKNKTFTEDELELVNQAMDSFLTKINIKSLGGSKSKLIEYGLNEKQLWTNFDIFIELSEQLEDGDQIYLDITHSFRSIPLFMYLMLDFIQNLENKEIELAGLYYGMFEVSEELEYSPIVDLSPLFEISKWIRGVYDFTNYGNGYLMAKLLKEADDNLAERIINVSELVNINYLTNLKTQVRKLKEALGMVKVKEINVLTTIRPKLEEFLNRFDKIETDWEFQLEVANWYYENKRYANAYICLVESILTYLSMLYDLDSSEYNNRIIVKQLLSNWKIKNKYSKLNHLMELREVYKKANNVRKNVAHSSLTGNKRNFSCDIENIEKYYYKVRELLNGNEIKNLKRKITLKELKKLKKD